MAKLFETETTPGTLTHNTHMYLSGGIVTEPVSCFVCGSKDVMFSVYTTFEPQEVETNEGPAVVVGSIVHYCKEHKPQG